MRSHSRRRPAENKFKEHLASIGALITVLVTAFGLFNSVNKYLEQRNKAYSVTYTNQMIDFLDDLKIGENEESDKAILLLSSYELDAVPILLFYLENESSNRKEIYLRSLKIISRKESVDKAELLKIVIDSSKEFLLSKFGKAYSDEKIQKQKIYALRNYIFVLSELSSFDKKKIKNQLNWMLQKIEQDHLPDNDKKLLMKKIEPALEKMNS